MSSHLKSKGIKSTRLVSATVIWFTGTFAWLLLDGKFTGDQWWMMSVVILGIYAGSEYGIKNSIAGIAKARETKNDS